VAIVQPKDTKLEIGFRSGRDLLPECGLTTCIDTTGAVKGLAEVGHFTIAKMMSIAMRSSVTLNIKLVAASSLKPIWAKVARQVGRGLEA
jgi:hypothetical protein